MSLQYLVQMAGKALEQRMAVRNDQQQSKIQSTATNENHESSLPSASKVHAKVRTKAELKQYPNESSSQEQQNLQCHLVQEQGPNDAEDFGISFQEDDFIEDVHEIEIQEIEIPFEEF